jgi:8-oxo-dGTP diphosphatase
LTALADLSIFEWKPFVDGHYLRARRYMKPKGTSLIFVNDQGQVLLLLRDNTPGIPCANMWDLPGGHVEEGETPRECICREMKEELGLDLEGVEPFSVMEFEDRTEYVFWKGMNLAIDRIRLTEGQRLRWFSRTEAEGTPLAFGFNDVLAAFFRDVPRPIDT